MVLVMPINLKQIGGTISLSEFKVLSTIIFYSSCKSLLAQRFYYLQKSKTTNSWQAIGQQRQTGLTVSVKVWFGTRSLLITML